MAIDRDDQSDSGDLMFVLRDPEHLYTHDEVCDLLKKAERLGFSLDKGSELGRCINMVFFVANMRTRRCWHRQHGSDVGCGFLGHRRRC